MKFGEITEEQLLKEFRNYIDENNENDRFSKGVHLLETLLNETEHWLPSTIKYYTYEDKTTTNRIDCFFHMQKDPKKYNQFLKVHLNL